VVYGPDMADRVATSVTRASSKVNANTNVSAEQLAEEVRAAQAAGSATPQPG
jgi:collagenase-like PrtC family protease